MATPIQITPALSGKASAYFNKSLKKHSKKKASKKEIQELEKYVNTLLSKNSLDK